MATNEFWFLKTLEEKEESDLCRFMLLSSKEQTLRLFSIIIPAESLEYFIPWHQNKKIGCLLDAFL